MEINMILDNKITFFNSTTSIEAGNTISIKEVLDSIKEGKYKKEIDELRGVGNENIKKTLPTFAMHGIFSDFRKKTDFIEASGIIILDIDDVEDDLEEVKEDIMESSNNVLAAMISPSGTGIKVLYYVQPELVTADNYRQIGKQISIDFEMYGHVDYLSVTDCLIATYDPNIKIAKNVVPAFIYIKEAESKVSKLEPYDNVTPLWENVEDFFETALAESISERASSNFHYIQIAVLDLAKFGFYHPNEDLSFVVDYAEECFHHSPENKKRFLEVAEIAKQYPQQKWAYRFIKDEENDDFNDYSEYKTKPLNNNTDDKKEDSDDCFVDYEEFFNSILSVISEGDRVGFEISLKNFAEIFRFKGSGILTITGIPGCGKTEFTDACMLDLARLYLQKSIICGFEQTPEEHVIKLIRKMLGLNITCPSYFNKENEPTIKKAYDFITKHIFHIDIKKTGGNINTILDAAAKKIKEERDKGGSVKYLVIDPFNMLSIKGKLSGHEKIEEILRRLTHFSHQMDVMVILIAHPFKMKKDEKTGKYEMPDFYSVKGSSAFFEMSYHGLVVYRTGYESTDPVIVKVLKVKQNNLGNTGDSCSFLYEKQSGRYIPIDEEGCELKGDQRDKCWLDKALNNNNK